jgi:hypothetical protein
MEEDKLYKEVDNKDGTITLTPKDPDFGKIYPFGKQDERLYTIAEMDAAMVAVYNWFVPEGGMGFYPRPDNFQDLKSIFINSLNKT